MLFAIVCKDRPGALDVRLNNRGAHVSYLESQGDRLVMAGPTLTDGGDMNGSIIVIDFDDRAACESFCANDPYAQAGLFEKVTISSYKKVLPR